MLLGITRQKRCTAATSCVHQTKKIIESH